MQVYEWRSCLHYMKKERCNKALWLISRSNEYFDAGGARQGRRLSTSAKGRFFGKRGAVDCNLKGLDRPSGDLIGSHSCDYAELHTIARTGCSRGTMKEASGPPSFIAYSPRASRAGSNLLT